MNKNELYCRNYGNYLGKTELSIELREHYQW